MRTVETIEISISEAGTSYTRVLGVDDTTEKIAIFANATAVDGTAPTLDITPQWSVDGGTVWFDAEDSGAVVQALAQITGVAKEQKHIDAIAPLIKFKLVAGGVDPEFTVTLSVVERGAS